MKLRSAFVASLSICAALVAHAPAAVAAADRVVVVGLGIHYIVPGYEALAEAAAEQHARFEDFCAAPGAARLKASQTAFAATLDGWIRVQHIRFGPIDVAFRAQRISHWPERRNAVDRALADLLAKRDRAALQPEAFAKSSVAAQGLPALERLLYEDGALPRFEAGDEAARYRCALGLAIGRNLMTITHEVAGEWRSQVLPALAAGGGSLYFPDPRGATKLLVEDLHLLLQLVADLKLERVLGPSVEAARPDLAENRRSGRSVRNILINLQSAADMYGQTEDAPGLCHFVRDAPGGDALDLQLRGAFDRALAAARSLPEPLDEAAVDPGRRPAIEAALRSIEALRKAYREQVPQAAGVKLGFTQFGD